MRVNGPEGSKLARKKSLAVSVAYVSASAVPRCGKQVSMINNKHTVYQHSNFAFLQLIENILGQALELAWAIRQKQAEGAEPKGAGKIAWLTSRKTYPNIVTMLAC